MIASDITALCSLVIALAAVVGEPQLETLWPGHGPWLAGVLAVAAVVAAQVIRIYSVKAGAPATAITSNAAVVASDTAVVTSATPVVAINTTHVPQSNFTPTPAPAPGKDAT